jgi:hypothetical protein
MDRSQAYRNPSSVSVQRKMGRNKRGLLDGLDKHELMNPPGDEDQ